MSQDMKQALLTWLHDGGLCQQCGACCFLPVSILSKADVTRLEKACKTDLVQIGVLYRFEDLVERPEDSEYYFDLQSGHCPAFEAVDGIVSCRVYGARPEFCREWTCGLYQDVERWVAGDRNPRSNVLASCISPQEVKRRAEKLVPTNISYVRGFLEAYTRSEVGELEDCKDAVRKALDSLSFSSVIQEKS